MSTGHFVSPPDDDAPQWERHPAVRTALARAMDLGAQGTPTAVALARALGRAQGAAPKSPASVSTYPRQRSWGGRMWSGAGAVLVGLLAFAGVTYWWASPRTSRVVQARAYATQPGQRSAVTFPDGTRAMLAPGTRVRYAASANGERIVELAGQAFFDVTHAATVPFTVHARGTATRVLGTTFDIQAYDTDPSVQVAVVSGKIATRVRGRDVVLTPGMVVRVTDSAVTRGGNAEKVVGWTTGQLAFDDATVASVLRSVGRWYGYEFRLADSTLAAQHVTIVVRVDDPTRALRLLEEVLNVSFVITDRVITLRPRPPIAAPRAPTRERDGMRSHSQPEVGK